MTLQELGAIGEWIGGIAVLITIVYLAIQVRALRQEMHLNSYRDQTESYNAAMHTDASSVELAVVLEKAEDDVGSLERWEWSYWKGIWVYG